MQPPVISGLTASPNVLDPPNHKMVPVTLAVSATDDSGCGPPRCRIISVTSNEPADGVEDGSPAPDWEVTGDLTLSLRAERSGAGTGRVYTVTVQCTDILGKTATAAVTVSVPLVRPK